MVKIAAEASNFAVRLRVLFFPGMTIWPEAATVDMSPPPFCAESSHSLAQQARKISTSDSSLLRERATENDQGCFRQVCPASEVTHTSPVAVVSFPCSRSVNSRAAMSAVRAAPLALGFTWVQCP